MDKEDFKSLFNLPFNGFLEPIDFIDGTFGFSTIKKYPNNYASLFRIVIGKEILENPDEQKALTCTVSYGKKTEGGITLSSSTEKIKGLNDPIDIVSDNEFSFNLKTKKFFYKDEIIEAKKILELLDKWHKKTTKPLSGAWLRIKLLWFHIILTHIFKFIFQLSAEIIYLVSGTKFKIYQNLTDMENRLEPLFPSNIKKEKPKQLIDIFGFKVEPEIAFIYSLFHLIIYIVFYVCDYHPQWLVTMFKNIFLTVMYVIVSLGLAKIAIPCLLKPFKISISLLGKIQLLYFKNLGRKIKI